MIQLGFEGLHIRHGIVSNNDAWRFHKPGFYAVVQAEIADDPAKQGFLVILLSGRCKRSSGKIVTSQNVPRFVDAVKTTDPNGSLLLRFLLLLGQLGLVLRVFAPCVVRLVVNDQNVAGVGHFAQHLTCICLVAFRASLVHAAALGNGLLTVPGQCLPVGDHDLTLVQLVHETHRDDAELIVIVVVTASLKDLQAALDRQTRSHDKHIF